MTPTPSTSSTSSQDEHPEVADISALSEGILPVERQEALHAHLADCELCADVRASLDEIREALGTLPDGGRMPQDVANRIDAALAAEALLDATVPDEDAAAVSRETANPETARGESASAATEETAAAHPSVPPEPATDGPRAERTDSVSDPAPAAVSRETRGADRPPGRAPGSTGPGRPSEAPGRRRSRRRRTTLIIAASVAVLGIGGVTVQTLSDNPQGVEASSGQAPKEDASKSTRSGAGDDRQLRHRVQTLLARQDSGAPSQSGPGAETGRPGGPPTVGTKRSPSKDATLQDDRAGGMGTAPSCVRDGIRRAENPLAVDAHASYEGRSGYLVVLPHRGGDSQRVDAYMVDPSCVDADPSGPGKVLLKRTYPRE